MAANKPPKKTEEHKFGAEFMKRYLSHGFGTMTKSEIDILAFHLIKQQSQYREQNNYELARSLRITEAKVKSLTLNASIRYSEINHKAEVANFVEELLNKDKLAEFENGEVKVGIEDPAKKAEIEYAIKKTGRTPEYGRNREILRFSSETLLALIIDNVEKGSDEFKMLVEDNVKLKKNHKKILDSALSASDKASLFISGLSDKASLISLLAAGGKLAFDL